MYRYEVMFPIIGVGFYYVDSKEKLNDSDAIKQAWENIQYNDTLDEYNWEVFLKESDASPLPEAIVTEGWEVEVND